MVLVKLGLLWGCSVQVHQGGVGMDAVFDVVVVDGLAVVGGWDPGEGDFFVGGGAGEPVAVQLQAGEFGEVAELRGYGAGEPVVGQSQAGDAVVAAGGDTVPCIEGFVGAPGGRYASS